MRMPDIMVGVAGEVRGGGGGGGGAEAEAGENGRSVDWVFLLMLLRIFTLDVIF